MLGFEEDVREEGDERRAAILRGADGRSSLAVTEHVGSSSNDDAFEPSHIGLDHVAFTVASLDELHEWADRLTDQGIEQSGVIEIPPGAILNLKDPTASPSPSSGTAPDPRHPADGTAPSATAEPARSGGGPSDR